MKQLLEDVRSGKHAKEWIAENEAGRPVFNKLREADRNHQIEQVGARRASDAVPGRSPLTRPRQNRSARDGHRI